MFLCNCRINLGWQSLGQSIANTIQPENLSNIEKFVIEHVFEVNSIQFEWKTFYGV